MTTQSCNCAALKLQIESLLLANKQLLAENGRLRTEVRTFRVLIGQMKELRERELSDSSEPESDDEDGDVGREAETKLDDVSDDEVICLDSDDSADEAEDVEMETVEKHQDEVDEVKDDAVKEQSADLNDSFWKQKSAWKCAKCQNVVRGGRYHRLRHLAAHKEFKLSCPLDGCSTRATLGNLNSKHLQRHHHVSYDKLTKTQKEQLGKEREKCLKKSREFEREFFPRKNFCKVIESRKQSQR